MQKINKNFKTVLVLLLSLSFSFTLFSQTAENVAVTTTNDKIIVAYDLTGKKSALYEVDLKFRLADGKTIVPKSLNGDYGTVEAGKGKAIIWDLYKDVNGLSGAIDPEISVTEIVPKKKKEKVQDTPTPPAPQKPTVDIDMGNDKGLFNNNNTTRYGFKIGLGQSSVESNLRRDMFHSKFSYELGAFFRWHKQRRFYIQPEILYHFQHYEERYNLEENAFSRHHYVRGQALAGIAPFGLGLYFNGGVYYGYLLGGSEKQLLEDETIERTFADFETQNGVDNPFKQHDLGFIIGGSLSIKKGAFALGALYSQSFDSFIDPTYYNGDATNENLRLKNRGWHFFIQRAF